MLFWYVLHVTQKRVHYQPQTPRFISISLSLLLLKGVIFRKKESPGIRNYVEPLTENTARNFSQYIVKHTDFFVELEFFP